MTKEELLAARNRFSPVVGERVTYRIPERGSWRYGYGDVVKLNRLSVVVVDKKFPGEEVHVVDRAFLIDCASEYNDLK